jgi:hypothetical protein
MHCKGFMMGAIKGILGTICIGIFWGQTSLFGMQQQRYYAGPIAHTVVGIPLEFSWPVIIAKPLHLPQFYCAPPSPVQLNFQRYSHNETGHEAKVIAAFAMLELAKKARHKTRS